MLHRFSLALLAAVLVAAQDCTRPLLHPTECCSFSAPPSFNATFITTRGNVSIYAERSWSPYGVDRLYSLFMCDFFGGGAEGPTANAAGLFRVVPNFVVQFGIPGIPAVSAVWENEVIPNDPVVLSNIRGTLAYAAVQDAAGKAVNRTTQLYFNYANNSRLDALGFTPVAVVTDSMTVLDSVYSGYGEQPDQDLITTGGDNYLHANFPLLDYILGSKVAF